MKVFISWSGPRSKAVAAALTATLPVMLQAIEPWMSEDSLAKGKPWFDELHKALNEIAYGIFCVTNDNQQSVWMSWEAGLLSAVSPLGEKRVAPLAIGIDKNEIRGPLSVYQATDITREDILRLLKNINCAITDRPPVSDKTLDSSFELAWPKLEKLLQDALLVPAPTEKIAVKTDDRLDEIAAVLRDTQRQIGDTKIAVMSLAVASASGHQFVPFGFGAGPPIAGGGLMGNNGLGAMNPTPGGLAGNLSSSITAPAQMYSVPDMNTPLSQRKAIPPAPQDSKPDK